MAESARLGTLGRAVVDARAEYDKKHKAKAAAERKKDAAERDLFDYLRAEKIKGAVPVDLGEDYGVYSFRARETIRGRVFDPDAAQEAFEQEARVDEMYYTNKIRGKVLNDLVKERLETGQPLPAGVEPTRQPGITVTKK